MIGADFEQRSLLEYRNRVLKQQVADFQSGAMYRKMEERCQKLLAAYNREVRRLKKELEQAHKEIAQVRRFWLETTEDLEKENAKNEKRLQRQLEQKHKQLLKTEQQRDRYWEEKREWIRKYYEVAAELLEEKEQNRKLTAQVNQDFENSSIPSSLQKAGRKRIPNSREATGRKPGGQPGHKGHRRKRHTPTQSYEIEAPDYANHPERYYETGKTIRKQKVCIRLGVEVLEYWTKEYRDRETGSRVHARFPEGYTNEVNYDGSVKALAFLLGNECGVSHGKIRRLLQELTNGELQLSDGMINGLCREFSEKTEPEQKEIRRKLLNSPVLHADFTNASVNGKQAQVLVLASPSENVAMYIGREHKGHEGIQGTPLADYVGICVHDHDKTFYHYGVGHQECTQHDIRYLIGSIQNEPELSWNKQMLELLRKMVHYRNGLSAEEDLDAAAVQELEAEYDRILDQAEEEYEQNPPSDYYRKGYNLFRKLREYKEHELLFLHDKRVPADNSFSERLARVFKRKQKQAITLRSQESLCRICDGLSIVYLLRSKEGNVYQEIVDIYERRRPFSIQKPIPS